MSHEEFEKKVMELLLQGDGEVFAKLRKQYEVAKVTARDFTGVGFFTSFIVEDKELRLEENIKPFGDVGGFIDGEAQIGFVIFLRNGYLSTLEGYTFVIDWPEDYDNIVLKKVAMHR